MGNLASQQLTTQSDPDVVRRQILAERERQLAGISNPQQQLAARLGGLLGGGVTNLAQGRGFFDVNDPLLNKVTQIQGIYNQVASRVDPTADPARFYSELQSAYSNAGLGREALAASQEAQKAKGSALDMQLKETQVLEKNPELITGKIEEALKAGNEAEALRLANLKTRVDETRGLDVEKTKADIDRIKTQTREAQDRIDSGKYEWQVIKNAAGAPIGIQTINKKTRALEFTEVDPAIAKKYLDFGGDKTTDSKGGDKKKGLSQEEVNALVNQPKPAAAPAAATPAAATPRDMSAPNMAAYNQNTGVYRLNEDPIIKMISDYAGQNRTLLETDPEFARSITAAYANRREELTRTMGTGIRFQ
jgi:hypothetical protein